MLRYLLFFLFFSCTAVDRNNPYPSFILSKRDYLRSCFERAFKVNSRLRVVNTMVTVRIDFTGRVLNADASGSGFVFERQCMKEKLMELKFPKPQVKQSRIIKQPLQFHRRF